MNPPSPPDAGADPAQGLPIAAVERETGLGKDTLRVWEKRYGFPQPVRDAAGDRLYPAEQVERLRLICRLLNAGQRPGKVVGMDAAALQALMAELPASAASAPLRPGQVEGGGLGPAAGMVQAPALGSLLDAIAAHDPFGLRHALLQAQLRMGLGAFVIDLVAPLTTAVGQAWAQGRFEIFEEHLYTDVVTGVLRQCTATLVPPSRPNALTVLLTTVPQELHALGLLMVEALLTLEGCRCISLGTQTPLGDIVRAARAHQADVVALSFTDVHATPLVQASIRELRAQLPQETQLWVGGSCGALQQKPADGVTVVQRLEQLQALVAQARHDGGQTG